MTYLHHLAARTLNQLPVVQPRLPSRFESARHAPLKDRSAPVEYATFTSSAPSITMGTATFAPPATATEAPVVHMISDPPRATWEARSMSINPTVVQPPEIQRAGETDRVMPTPPIIAVESNTLTREIDHRTETIINNLINERTATIEQRTVIDHEREIAPMLVAPADMPRARRFVPHIEPYVSPEPELVAAPESNPVIHVSIGRIEVRAVQSPAPAPAAPVAPKHKIISLDDYLHGVRS